MVELAGGLLTGSLALVADAGHMLSDVASLGLALFAFWLAGRPATPRRSFGFKRAEILAALANGLALVVIALVIAGEAYDRLQSPHEVMAGWMLVVAVAGMAVNSVSILLLKNQWKGNLNIKAAMMHVFGDLLGSLGAVVAAIVILATGWLYIDPIVSILIAVLIMASAYLILRDSISVLLESAPAGIDASRVGEAMAAQAGVAEVHDLHIWTITSGFPALSAHVLVAKEEDCHRRRLELSEMLVRRFSIEHSTLQVEHMEDKGDILEIGG